MGAGSSHHEVGRRPSLYLSLCAHPSNVLESPCQASIRRYNQKERAMSDPGIPSQSQEVFHGDLLAVRVETIASPSGARRYEIVEHPDAVAIVALRDDPAGNEPQVALVRQSRPAIG